MGLFDRFKRKSTEEKLEKITKQARAFEEKATQFEGLSKARTKIRKAKRTIFRESPAGRAIGLMQKGARAFEGSGYTLGGDHLQEDGGGRRQRHKRKLKKSKRRAAPRADTIDWF